MKAHTEADPISVVIAEDKEVMRLGLAQMVASSPKFSVVGVVTNADHLLHLVATDKPDVILLKNNLPGGTLTNTLRRAREISPHTVAIVLLAQPEEFWAVLDSKAQGYCMREVPASSLQEAISSVALGRCYIGTLLASYLLRGDGQRLLQTVVPRVGRPSALDSLSRREKDVIALLSEGQTNEEIAQTLKLSIQTVKVHVKHILKKLKVSDRTQAAIKALKSS